MMSGQIPNPAASQFSKSGEAALWQEWIELRSVGAREQLLGMHLPYAKVVAATYYARRTHDEVEFEDYLQLARVGLLESFDRYDPSVGAQFTTFAARRMQGAILNGLERFTEKNQQIAVRRELNRDRLQSIKDSSAEQLTTRLNVADGEPGLPKTRKSEQLLFSYLAEVGIGVALGVMLEGTGMMEVIPSDEDAVASVEVAYFQKSEMQRLQDMLRALVSRLSEQERTVIRCHYLQEIPFEEIGKMLGVKRSRVSQIHQQALKNLRKALDPYGCDVFL